MKARGETEVEQYLGAFCKYSCGEFGNRTRCSYVEELFKKSRKPRKEPKWDVIAYWLTRNLVKWEVGRPEELGSGKIGYLKWRCEAEVKGHPYDEQHEKRTYFYLVFSVDIDRSLMHSDPEVYSFFIRVAPVLLCLGFEASATIADVAGPLSLPTCISFEKAHFEKRILLNELEADWREYEYVEDFVICGESSDDFMDYIGLGCYHAIILEAIPVLKALWRLDMKIKEPIFYTFGKCERCGKMLTEQEYMRSMAHVRRYFEDLDYEEHEFPPLLCDKCYKELHGEEGDEWGL